MKLTKATDYALILLGHLNTMDKDKITSVKEVAKICHIPKRFLANIVHRLSKGGILVTIKGMDGGIKLSRSSDKITIKDVLEVLEGNIRFVDCQTQGGICNVEDFCTIKEFWDAKLANFISALDNTTIKDLSNFSQQHSQQQM